MNTTCLFESLVATQTETIYCEVSQGPPVTREECAHHIDYFYFLSFSNSNNKRYLFRTIQELVEGYISKSRRIVQEELCPYPVRNKPEKDANNGSISLNDREMTEFKRVLSLMDAQRYHLSFPS